MASILVILRCNKAHILFKIAYDLKITTDIAHHTNWLLG